jgi:hypothetical protein
MESELPIKRVNGRMWVTGESGNPSGRPIGARGRFSQQFITDLSDAWQRYGADALAQTAKLYPDRFVGICSHLIPKDVSVSLIGRLPGGLEPDDWQLMLGCLDAIRTAMPDASKRPAGEVMAFVLDALRAHDAKVITG